MIDFVQKCTRQQLFAFQFDGFPFLIERLHRYFLLARETARGNRACLSSPLLHLLPQRNKVTVKALNQKGEAVELEGEELLARAFLHEIDHLKGVLFINHLSALKRILSAARLKNCKNPASGNRFQCASCF